MDVRGATALACILCLTGSVLAGVSRIGHVEIETSPVEPTLTLAPGLSGWTRTASGTIEAVPNGVRLVARGAPAGIVSQRDMEGRTLISFDLLPEGNESATRFECRFMLAHPQASPLTADVALARDARCYSISAENAPEGTTLVMRRLPDEAVVDVGPMPSRETAKPWRICITKAGIHIRVFVNGTPVLLWRDYSETGAEGDYGSGAVALAASAATFVVTNFATEKITRLTELPVEKLRDMHIETDLSRASIVIVDTPLHRELAARVAALIKTRTGVEPPVVLHTDILPALPGKEPLIVLGNMAHNLVIRKLYCEWFCMVDLVFPGAGGSVVQTIHDPWGTGQNIVLLGASDAAGLRQAVERFQALLPEAGPLGRLYDCRPAPQFAALRDYDPAKEPYLTLPLQYPHHYGLRSEAQQAAMVYLVTGDDRFASTYRQEMLKQTDAGFIEHLYLPAWPILWDLMEEHPCFSDAERLKITNWFLGQLRDQESIGALHIQRLHNNMPHQNHGTRPAVGSFFMARYFRDHYGLPEASVYLRRLSRYFGMQATWSKPMCDSSGHQWQATLENKATYALASGELTFFESGAARQAAERALRTTNNVGLLPIVGDAQYGDGADALLAKAAFYYRDPRYLWPLAQRGDVRSAQDELGRAFAIFEAPVPPEDIIGVSVCPYDKGWWEVGRFALPFRKSFRQPNVPYERAFDKIAFRTGVQRADEFLVLDGMIAASHDYDDVNTIHEYSRNGRIYVTTCDSFSASTMPHHNGVNIVRDGLASKVPSAAEWLHADAVGPVQLSQTRVNDFSGADWTRTIVLKPNSFFVVLDRVSARQPGQYTISSAWRLLGDPELSGDTLTVRQWPRKETRSTENTTSFHMQAPGQRTSYEEKPYLYSLNARYYPFARPNIQSLTASRAVSLAAGDSAWLYALGHETGTRPDPVWRLHEVAPGVVRIAGSDGAAYVGAPQGGVRIGLVEIVADVFYLDNSILAVAGGRRAVLAGKTVLDSETPTTTAVPLTDLNAVGKQLASADHDRQPPAAAESAALPSLDVRWRYQADGEIRTLRTENLGGDLGIVAVPSRAGSVIFLDDQGRVARRIEVKDKVNDVVVDDIDRDGRPEILVAREDCTLQCLDPDGQTRFEFAPKQEQIVNSRLWLGRNSMQRVWVADHDGKGPKTILVSSGDQRLHGLDARGERKWLFWTYAGIFTQFALCDVDGDGWKEIIGGNGEISDSATLWFLKGKDTFSRRIFVDGWGSTLSALGVGDINNDGREEIVAGTSRNSLKAYKPTSDEPLWEYDLGHAVEDIALAQDQGVPLVIAGSLSGFVVVFDGAGSKLGAVPVGAPVRRVAVFGSENDRRVAAICDGGEVVVFSIRGESQFRYNLGAEPVAVAVSHLAPHLLIVAGSDKVVTALSVPR